MSMSFSAGEFIKAHLRVASHRHQLQPLVVRDEIKSPSPLVVSVVRNELHRLAFFLHYYRELGFGHFIMIDNDSDDGTADFLRSQPDVSLFLAKGSYAGSRFGNDWINLVLGRYGAGRWVLYADPDEILTFPHCGRGAIGPLTRHLEARGDGAMRCTMIDMYGDATIGDSYVRPLQDPLEVCNYFDSYGYERRFEAFCNTEWIKGGVRGRLFFQDDIWAGPALNKTPLVKWRLGYCFLKSAHQLWPIRLNLGSRPGHGEVTGALLHFKFISTMPTKISEEVERRQHTPEYVRYSTIKADGRDSLMGPPSRAYRDWTTLVDLGLMNGREWMDAPSSKTP